MAVVVGIAGEHNWEACNDTFYIIGRKDRNVNFCEKWLLSKVIKRIEKTHKING